jgi:WbqC-like protein family
MKLAVMQPYLFPYIGYFQLVHAVDAFVVYDDVNYIKGGWINRNFILSQGEKARITLQLQGASPNVLINEVMVGGNRLKLLKTLRQSYTRAPQFDAVMPVFEEIIMFDEENLARYLDHGLRKTCAYLGLSPQWVVSSELQKNNELRGQEKVLSICKDLGASQYINPAGGKELYDKVFFGDRGVQLLFIDPEIIPYPQFGKSFVPHLSIIDVMMFNDKKKCKDLIEAYNID